MARHVFHRWNLALSGLRFFSNRYPGLDALGYRISPHSGLPRRVLEYRGSDTASSADFGPVCRLGCLLGRLCRSGSGVGLINTNAKPHGIHCPLTLFGRPRRTSLLVWLSCCIIMDCHSRHNGTQPMANQPIGHHHLPAFYLARFAVGQKRKSQFYVFDKERMQRRVSTPNGEAKENHFYTPGVEDVFGQFERRWANAVSTTLREGSILAGDLGDELICFVGMTVLRSRWMRQWLGRVADARTVSSFSLPSQISQFC